MVISINQRDHGDRKLLIRALEPISAGRTYDAGEQFEPDFAKALNWIHQGVAVPVIETGERFPEFPPDGLNLWQAYRLHLGAYSLDETSNDFLKSLSIAPEICPSHHLQEPKWRWLPKRKARGYRGQSWVTRDLYTRTPPITPSNNIDPAKVFDKSCRVHRANIATFHFLEKLREGNLQAFGVAEKDLHTLERSEIPPGWWSRRARLGLTMNAIYELGRTKVDEVRVWSDIVVFRAAGPEQTVRRSRGRPRRIDPVLGEYERRKEVGIVEKTPAAEGQALAHWDETRRPPPKQPLTADYIADTIRADLKIYWAEKLGP